MLACSDDSKKEIQQAKTMAIDSMKMQSRIKEAKQEVIDSMRMQAQVESAKHFTRDSLKDVKKPIVYAGKKYNSSQAESYVAKNPNNEVYTTPSDAPIYKPVKKKRRISRPVQGAIIGAGVGAVSGAIINKSNRGKGAVIGGIIGAGVGAGTGVIIDNKEKKFLGAEFALKPIIKRGLFAKAHAQPNARTSGTQIGNSGNETRKQQPARSTFPCCWRCLDIGQAAFDSRCLCGTCGVDPMQWRCDCNHLELALHFESGSNAGSPGKYRAGRYVVACACIRHHYCAGGVLGAWV